MSQFASEKSRNSRASSRSRHSDPQRYRDDNSSGYTSQGEEAYGSHQNLGYQDDDYDLYPSQAQWDDDPYSQYPSQSYPSQAFPSQAYSSNRGSAASAAGTPASAGSAARKPRDVLEELLQLNLYRHGRDRFAKLDDAWLTGFIPGQDDPEGGEGEGDGEEGEGEKSEAQDVTGLPGAEDAAPARDGLAWQDEPAAAPQKDGLTWQDEAPKKPQRDGLTWQDEPSQPRQRDGLTWQDEAPRPARRDGLTWQDEVTQLPEEKDQNVFAQFFNKKPKVRANPKGLNAWLRAHDTRRDLVEADRLLAQEAREGGDRERRLAAEAVANAPRPTAATEWFLVQDEVAAEANEGPWCWRADFVADVLAQGEAQGMRLAVTEASKAVKICESQPRLAQMFGEHVDAVSSGGRRELWSRAFLQSLDVVMELRGYDDRGVKLSEGELRSYLPDVDFSPVDYTPLPRPRSRVQVPAGLKRLLEEAGFERPQPPPLPCRLPTRACYPQKAPWTRILWRAERDDELVTAHSGRVGDSGPATPSASPLGEWPMKSPIGSRAGSEAASRSNSRAPSLVAAGKMSASSPSLSGIAGDSGAGVSSFISEQGHRGSLEAPRSALQSGPRPSSKQVTFGDGG